MIGEILSAWKKNLRGPFHQFSSGDTIEWFEKHGVTKIEDDGRMFPVSKTIIECFLTATQNWELKS
jgi:predicted flavoprotein YhiN